MDEYGTVPMVFEGLEPPPKPRPRPRVVVYALGWEFQARCTACHEIKVRDTEQAAAAALDGHECERMETPK